MFTPSHRFLPEAGPRFRPVTQLRHPVALRPPGSGGFTLVELAVVMVLITILGAASLFAFNRMIDNGNGTACTTNLNNISEASSIVSATQNFTTDAQVASGISATTIAPYLGNKVVNTDITCPAGGTYTLASAFQTGTEQLEDPTCTIATTEETEFKGTRFHSIEPVP